MSPDAALPSLFCAFLELDYSLIPCTPAVASASKLNTKKSTKYKKFTAKNLSPPQSIPQPPLSFPEAAKDTILYVQLC